MLHAVLVVTYIGSTSLRNLWHKISVSTTYRNLPCVTRVRGQIDYWLEKRKKDRLEKEEGMRGRDRKLESD